MLCLGDFGPTSTRPVTPDPASFRADRPHRRFAVLSDRNIHLRRSDSETIAPTAEEFLLHEGVYALVDVPPGEFLGYWLAEGEADGVIRITAVT